MQAQQVLHKILLNTCPDMHKMRRCSLEKNTVAALTGRRLTVTDLGRSISTNTNQKHAIKCADRLLSNVHLHKECTSIQQALARQLIGSHKRPIILIDWSDMDDNKQHFLLRAALAVDGRSLTLFDEIHTMKTKEKWLTHQQFLFQLKKILPLECKPILVTDAGFRITWFKLVESVQWDWVGRIRNRLYMHWTQGGPWFKSKQCYDKATSRPTYLGEGILTRSNEFPCRLVLYKGKLQGRKDKTRLGEVAKNKRSRQHATGQREPWLLATSLQSSSTLAKKLVRVYRLRMQIEEGFRDIKSHRFGLSLTYHRTSSVERLQILVLIATLAIVVLWLLGMAIVLIGKQYQFQANSIRNRRVLSLVFIGLQFIYNTSTRLSKNNINAAWWQLNVIQDHFDE